MTRGDSVTLEEPLEIRILSIEEGEEVTRSISVTMRTPGADFELAAGFLFTEGIVTRHRDIADISYCGDVEVQEYNIVTVRLREFAAYDPSLLNRNFYMTSSCGVCGKASLEALEVRGCELLPLDGFRVPADTIFRIPAALRAAQPVFERTGGIHAAGLFDRMAAGFGVREDVGRHNAVDKVLGRAFLGGSVPLADRILAVSGRSSFEIVQKALAGGVPMIVAVGAPSSLAIDLARRFRMTLVGFAKEGGFNAYSVPERIEEWRSDGRGGS